MPLGRPLPYLAARVVKPGLFDRPRGEIPDSPCKNNGSRREEEASESLGICACLIIDTYMWGAGLASDEKEGSAVLGLPMV